VLGAPSSAVRAVKAAQLLERGFTANPLSWLTPALGTVDSLQPINAAPPNLREEMCGKHRKRQATEDEDDSAAIASIASDSPYAVFLSSLRAPSGKQNLLMDARIGEPVTVFTGTGAAKKPGDPAAPKIATADPKAKSGSKNTAKPPARPATASAVPWTSLSPSSITDHAPSELSAKPVDGADKPVPAKPKATKKASTQDPSKAQKSSDKSSESAKKAASKSKSSPDKTSEKSEKK
jgi:D-alanyl-D-alanine carboxypeptidase